jgi:CYTH domain-containing protein
MEIERKFWLTKEEANQWHEWGENRQCILGKYQLTQGYLLMEGDACWRVRLSTRGNEQKAYWTYKASTEHAWVRQEEEEPMSVETATALLSSCKRKLEKERAIIAYDGQSFELDTFSGSLDGLYFLEIELNGIGQKINWPEGLPRGIEVTEDERFINAQLACSQMIPRIVKRSVGLTK